MVEGKTKEKPSSIFFSNKEINQIAKKTDIKIKKALDLAYTRIKKFHSKQKVLNFLDQIIAKARHDSIEESKKVNTYCETFYFFHLKELKNLIEEDD